MKDKKQVTLELLEREVQMMVSDKMWDIMVKQDVDPFGLRAGTIQVIGRALGETFDTIKFPSHWERFLRRKDCPQYMKQLTVVSAHAYYPRLSIPEEKSWLTFDLHQEDYEKLEK